MRKVFWPSLRLVAPVLLALVSGARATEIKYQNTDAGLKIEGVSPACPMVYDNDWMGDTPDKNYLWAKASLGRADLRGNIVSRDLWDWQKGYQFSMQQGLDDARKSLALARRSGLQNIPDAIAGADRAFARPASGKIEDTPIVPSAGSDLIVREAKKASAQKPLLVFVGGPLNTVANALLIDPSIAPKVVVLMTDLRGYNGKDEWANHIVAARCRLVNFGAALWWPQRPAMPSMPLDCVRALPPSESNADLLRLAEGFWNRSTRADKPDRDDGFADGAGLFLIFEPRSWKRVQRQREEGIFGLRDVDDADQAGFDVLDAREVDFGLMREEFFRTLSDPALYKAPAKAAR